MDERKSAPRFYNLEDCKREALAIKGRENRTVSSDINESDPIELVNFNTSVRFPSSITLSAISVTLNELAEFLDELSSMVDFAVNERKQ